MEALFSSPGAFVHSEIEVSSHCIRNTGNLRHNIPNITHTAAAFTVSLLAQLSRTESLIPVPSALSDFQPQDNKGNLVEWLNIFLQNIFCTFCFTDLAGVFHRGEITDSERVITGQAAKCLFSTPLKAVKTKAFFRLWAWPSVMDCEHNSHLQNFLKHTACFQRVLHKGLNHCASVHVRF